MTDAVTQFGPSPLLRRIVALAIAGALAGAMAATAVILQFVAPSLEPVCSRPFDPIAAIILSDEATRKGPAARL